MSVDTSLDWPYPRNPTCKVSDEEIAREAASKVFDNACVNPPSLKHIKAIIFDAIKKAKNE